MKDYADYDALGLAELVRSKQVKPEELLDAALTRAETAQDTLNCFTTLEPDLARRAITDGLPEGPFAGVPFATKDLGVEVKGVKLTNGCRAYKDNIATRDSTLTTRYRKAGLVLFGVTNSPEFGLTTTTESILHGQTRNPWDLTRTSGGSSGGASAAVCAGVLPIANASDGGGSIRIPAACCGLVGMKPSRGRTPMGPARTEGWLGQSVVHAVSRSVRDNAALLDATCGRETGARYVAPPPERSYLEETQRDPKQLKIALWRTAPNGTEPSEEAAKGLAATARLLESLGHIVEEAAPKLDGDALSKGALFNISANIAAVIDEWGQMRGKPVSEDELEPITFQMANLGRNVPMVELARANNAFITAAIAFEQFLDTGGYDLTLSPTLSRPPELLGRMALDAPPSEMAELVGSFTPHCPVFNQMGMPAISLPLHWSAATETAPDGLPMGMMFGGRCGDEGLLYALSGQLERAAPWSDRKPPLWLG